jgi:cell wall-associated NlpC family hydrolase
MNTVRSIPDIHAFVDPLLGKSYEIYDCWNLVRYLLKQGFDLDLVRDAETAAQRVQEVWYRGDAVEPLTIVQPWDLVIIANHEDWPVSDHVGLAVDQQFFVHARRSDTGVALARWRSWRPRLLQLARLRELL